MKQKGSPVASFDTTTKDYKLNIYQYHHQLVGVIEDINYLQIFELEKYMTPTDYIDWRFHVCWPSPILNVYGKPLKNDMYLRWIHEVAMRTGIPVYETTYKKYF